MCVCNNATVAVTASAEPDSSDPLTPSDLQGNTCPQGTERYNGVCFPPPEAHEKIAVRMQVCA